MRSLLFLSLALCVSLVTAQEGSYSYYNIFHDSPTTDGAYCDGYYIGGPFRANGAIRLVSSTPGRDNDPYFYSFTLSSDYYVYGWGAGTQCTTPHYENLWIEPYELMEQGPPWFNLGVDPLPFGADQVEWQVVRAAALSYGLYLTSTDVPDGSRILLEDGQISVKTDENSAPVVYNLSNLDEPVVWIENGTNDMFYLKGHPDSQGLSEELTIGTSGSIYFSGPLEYNGDTPGMLGLISVYGDGRIADKPSVDWDPPYEIGTDSNLTYSASILLLDGVFEAENFTQPNPQVDFTLYGGCQIQQEGYTGSSASGFALFWEYDERLFNQSPPWYPQYELSGVESADTPLSDLELIASCNPFSSSVSLTMTEPGTLTVYDSSGRIVDSCDTDGGWVWNGSLLPGGVYIVNAKGMSGNSTSLRLVKF